MVYRREQLHRYGALEQLHRYGALVTEPIYTFVKGQGWVVVTCASTTYQYQGRSYTIYARKPAGEEIGIFSGRYNEFYVDQNTGEPRLGRWKGYLESGMGNCMTMKGWENENDGHLPKPEDAVWITVIPND